MLVLCWNLLGNGDIRDFINRKWFKINHSAGSPLISCSHLEIRMQGLCKRQKTQTLENCSLLYGALKATRPGDGHPSTKEFYREVRGKHYITRRRSSWPVDTRRGQSKGMTRCPRNISWKYHFLNHVMRQVEVQNKNGDQYEKVCTEATNIGWVPTQWKTHTAYLSVGFILPHDTWQCRMSHHALCRCSLAWFTPVALRTKQVPRGQTSSLLLPILKAYKSACRIVSSQHILWELSILTELTAEGEQRIEQVIALRCDRREQVTG